MQGAERGIGGSCVPALARHWGDRIDRPDTRGIGGHDDIGNL